MFYLGIERGANLNNHNLRPFTVVNASENGAKGGKASGESKRQKKLLREYVTELLTLPAEELRGQKGTDGTNSAAVAVSLLTAAKSGDTKAMRLLFELVGELDRNKVAIEINQQEVKEAYEKGQKEAIDNVVKMLDDDTLRKIAGLTQAE